MASGKKSNGNSPGRPEYIFEDNKPKDELVATLERALRDGYAAASNGTSFKPTSCEAVLVKMRPDVKILCLKWHSGWDHPIRGEHYQGRAKWVPAYRLGSKRIGSQDVVAVRRFVGVLTLELHALCEAALGRSHEGDDFKHYRDSAKEAGRSSENVELEAVAMRRGRFTVLYVKHAGLWLSHGHWHSAEPVMPRRRTPHARVAIV